ncbi:MAG: metalloregulator ArsR/SmtB family transcription factor [bacterium]|nr:metalloregulator ArsR/SmtB family transcription factor [bacterium]
MKLEESIAIIKALADNSRLTIVNALSDRPHYVEELAERLDLAVSTVSFHLKKLEKAGLVSKKKEQYYVMFYSNQDVLSTRLRDLINVKDIPKDGQEERMLDYRRKVVQSFFRNGIIAKMPAQQKKRKILLEEIAKRFEPRRIYKEQELNEIILEVYEDYCTVRREMIGWGMMDRDGEKYWRLNDKLSGPSLLWPQNKPSQGKHTMDRRKELKQQYKNTPTIAGVLQMKNLKNGKMFIGSGLNVQSKLNGHRIQLQIGSHRNKALMQDWKEYGAENFSFDILETLELKGEISHKDREELQTLEGLWLEKLQPYDDKGYNRRPKKT